MVETPAVSESAPAAGASFTLSATVRNQGSARSDLTTLRYYQSSDSTITTGDTEVGTDSVFRLSASASGDESISLDAPLTPGTYYYGACVDALSDEANTTNNCSFAIPVTVGAAPAPDLVVDTVTVSESAPAAGASFTLSATVRNQGAARSDSTTLRYYQSSDSTITTGDTEVGTDSVSRLSASASGDESISLDAPSTPGTYYYGACVDEVDGELDTQNNCSSSVTVTVGAAPAPDLVVDTPAVSESAPAAGASFTLSATVRNQGNARSDSTTLRYYQSTDSTITTGDTEVGTDFVFGLSASASGGESISLDAPSTPGTYYYGACVDEVSGELDTQNNCSFAIPVTVGAAPAPDLVVDTPTVSESAPAAGASFTLSATVRNQGAARSDSTTLRYYQSSDSTITDSDTEVGTDSVFGLAASASGGESISLTAPSEQGTYYYGACVDEVSGELDTANNCSLAVTVAVGAAPAPDLVVDTVTVSESAPAAGASFTLSATVRNQGNGASSSTTLRYYQSSDSTITSGDTEVGTDSVSSLDASASGDESISLTAPSEQGIYYYGACVGAVSDESDTANNCSATVTVTVGTVPAPDLVVEGLNLGGSVPIAGEAFLINATVHNRGSAPSPSTTLRYYLSTDSTISSSDTLVDTVSVIRLGASGGYVTHIRPTAPSTPGTYYYGACVGEVSGELDTENNCSAAMKVTVGAAPAPDLVVDTPTVSESAPATGASFTLSATVRNQGAARSESTTLRYYQSTDSTITTGDTEVGTDSVSRLSASASGADSISLTAPSTHGTYYFGACVDAVSDESDTTNNCSAAVQVTVGATTGGNRYGVGDALPGVPTSGTFIPAVTVEASVQSSVGNTTITFNDGGYIELQDGTRYTCESSGGCEVVNGEVTRGTLAGQTTTTSSPDLIVGAPTVSESAPAAGASFTLSATVRNQGAARSASTTLRYYQSSDSTITTGDTEVGTDSVFGLSSSGNSDESIDLTAPSTAGTYYYGACVDEVSGESTAANNCSVSAQVIVPTTAPDLAIRHIGPDGTIAGSNPVAGTEFDLYVQVHNIGTEASAATTLRYYRSSDSTITESDAEVGTDSVDALRPGGGFIDRSNSSLTAPDTPATYYYGACVDSVSNESDTTNNCSTAVEITVVAPPDMVVDTPEVGGQIGQSPVTLRQGQSFDLYARVRNQGNDVVYLTTVHYYLSTDATITTSDTVVGTKNLAGGPPTRISLTAPETSGTHYYGACADSIPLESDTSNNCSDSLQVFVEPPPAPDLVVDTPTVSDSSLTAGDSFTLSFTVSNQGNRSYSSPTTLRYYRSYDAEFDSHDVEVAAETSRSGIPMAGKSFTSDRITAHKFFAPSSDGRYKYPYVSRGTYYYIVCVDPVSDESDTTNNCSNGVEVSATTFTASRPCIIGYVLTPLDQCYHRVQGKFGVIYGEEDAFNSGLGFIYHQFGEIETITRSISGRGPGNRQTTVHIINWADDHWLVRSVLTSAGNERIIELRFWED